MQANGLARQADSAAKTRRQAVSYINNTQVSGGITTIVGYRTSFTGIVPDVNSSSNGSTTYQGKRYIYSYRTIPSRGLLLLRASSAKSAAWHPFLGDLLLAALAGAALAAALSFFVARSIVRPIRRVADASHALAAGETPRHVPEEGARELASLAQAFNEMALQLETSRAGERNFLLSVSHELKTPLTAIRGYAEGLSEGAFTADEASADDPRRGPAARAARARSARPRADEPPRVLGRTRCRRARRASPGCSRPSRGVGAGLRRHSLGRRRRVLGRGRPRPAAPGRLQPGRERAPRDTAGRDGHSALRPAPPECLRHGPGPGARRPPACVRPLLPLRQVRPRAARSEAASASRSSSSSRRRCAGRSPSSRPPGRARPSS